MNSATPAPAGIADPSVWIAAHGAMAAALAQFQAKTPVAPSPHITDVIAAMRQFGAFELGFAHARRRIENGLEVILHHSSGWDTSAECQDCPIQWGSTLAGLLGLHITRPQASEADVAASAQLDQLIEQADALAATPAAEPEPQQEAEEEPVSLMGPGQPDNEVLPENLAPLSDSDKATAIGMLKSLATDARKAFTVQFRDHFNVPSSSKTITPHITQKQHLDFIQTFLNELELSGVA